MGHSGDLGERAGRARRHRFVAIAMSTLATTLVAGACCVPFPSSRSTSTTPSDKATTTASFSASQRRHEYLATVRYPEGLPEGEPWGTLTVKRTDYPDKVNQQKVHLTVVPQDPPMLTHSVVNALPSISSDDDVTSAIAIQQLPVCDGCTKRYLVTAELTTPLPEAEPGSIPVPLSVQAEQHQPGNVRTEPKPTLELTALDDRQPEANTSSETQNLTDVRYSVPEVRFASAQVSGPTAIRLVADTPDLDFLVLPAPPAGQPSGSTTSGTASATGNSTTRRRSTATTAAPSGVAGADLQAVAAGSWLPVGGTCDRACRVGVFVIATPQHDRPALDDTRSRSASFHVEVAEAGNESLIVTQPFPQGDSRDLDLDRGEGSGRWQLSAPNAPAWSIVLAGVFYKDGTNIARGQLAGRPFEISSSSVSRPVLVSAGCRDDCPSKVEYSTDATGALLITTWAAIYSVDPNDPGRKIDTGTVTRG